MWSLLLLAAVWRLNLQPTGTIVRVDIWLLCAKHYTTTYHYLIRVKTVAEYSNTH